MKVLITGGAGFIGSHTCDALIRAGHDVRVLDCLDPQIHGEDARFPAFLPSSVETLYGDVCSLSDCMSALEGMDAVLHLAARTGVGQSMYDIADYVETNVRGTATLVEAIVKSDAPVRRLVLASSRAIYGEGIYQCREHGLMHPGPRSRDDLERGEFAVLCPECGHEMTPKPTSEECAAAPLSAYAWTKVHQEDYCRWAQKTFNIPTTILRYFNVYGSRQSLKNPYTGVVAIFYSLLKAGRPLSLYEGGRPIRDFVHIQDVVSANLLALDYPEGLSGVFNVGSGNEESIADIAHALASALGVAPQLEDRGEFRVGDIYGCFADLANSRQALGYTPKVSLDDGMSEFVEWAGTEESVDLYDKTVAELDRHGLFGRASPQGK
jgi:dTDP-L-rhamnose 4-epimerase